MIIGISGRIGSGKDTVGKLIQYIQVEQLIEMGIRSVQSGRLSDVLTSVPLNGTKWTIKKYADKLKEMAGMFLGVPRHMFEDQEFKNSVLGPEWNIKRLPNLLKGPKGRLAEYEYFYSPLTVREFLQKLGTEAVRFGLHKDAWVNALYAEYQPTEAKLLEGFYQNGYDYFKFEDWYKYKDMKKMRPYSVREATVLEHPSWIITDVRFPNEFDAVKSRGGITIKVIRKDNPYPENDHEGETALDKHTFDYVLHNDGELEYLLEQIREIKECV